eukprot:CAMPEP_0197825308 /NCGR_PEP_ID=MMETSP1437-20131217/2405_1 /TAXON_ID=49252 ORGANISM="Eucampia antarctica, Strain CCMP1452" /NCGR_SAMPLE_ID=MMETSP1437 /ASSEMBLY_ACC=CAM_ASM_001096 /LENGTH=206 /DNA_ID=CAMNT_0043425243 /DNA_START=67 /DNA_END=687 /DNA_ORIENTATION=+
MVINNKVALCFLIAIQSVAAFTSKLSVASFSVSNRGRNGAATAIASALEEIPEADADPFDAYAPGSSLVYKELTPGSGDPCKKGDVLTVSYTGRLLRGAGKNMIDSNEAWTFKHQGGNVMPGFDEGLKGAKAGSKRIIKIPPAKAYGSSGRGNMIPPNSDLEFEIEVTEIFSGIRGEIRLFGDDRAIRLVAIVALLAIIPKIPFLH